MLLSVIQLDFNDFDMETLRRYRRRYQLDVELNAAREELVQGIVRLDRVRDLLRISDATFSLLSNLDYHGGFANSRSKPL